MPNGGPRFTRSGVAANGRIQLGDGTPAPPTTTTTTTAPTTSTSTTTTSTPTSTTTAPAPAVVTFGSPASGTANVKGGAGYQAGSVATLSATGTATSFSFWAKGGTVNAQVFRPIIYRVDAAGRPTTFVVQGPEVTIAANQAKTRVRVPLPPTTLTAGRYLLGLIGGPANAGASLYFDPETGAGFAAKVTYPTSPSTFGTPTTEPRRWSFSVDVATAAGPATTTTTSGRHDRPSPDDDLDHRDDHDVVDDHDHGDHHDDHPAGDHDDRRGGDHDHGTALGRHAGLGHRRIRQREGRRRLQGGSIWTLSVGGTATSFAFWAKGGGTNAERFRPVVYRVDAAGNPTTLVVAGPEVTVAANQAKGLVRVALPPTALSPGRYLLGVLCGPANAGTSLYFDPEVGAGLANKNAFPTPSATFGTPNGEPRRWSFSVAVTPT